MRVVVTEYPKSGGSWLVSMIGDALGIPKRDIYVTEEFNAYDIRKHPWYADAETNAIPSACVVKSHENPNSLKIDFPARYVHLIRDGRDVVVSKFFFESEFCVKNGHYAKFDTPFDVYVGKVAADWKNYVSQWLDQEAVIAKYEDLLADPPVALGKILQNMGAHPTSDKVAAAVTNNTKDRFSRSLDEVNKHNTFVRKGIHGDWRNHFNERHIADFKRVAGDLLIRLGYEMDTDW